MKLAKRLDTVSDLRSGRPGGHALFISQVSALYESLWNMGLSLEI